MHRFATAAALAVSAGIANASPDIICGELTNVNSYSPVGDIRAYAVGTTACNKGTSNANWIANSVNHPVISTTLFKLEDGRLRQIGVSFVKHSWGAIQGNACGFGCQSGGNWQALGPGCSDPYSANLNAVQTDLGPRFEINAYTGEFPWPPAFINQTGNQIFKRLQVPNHEMVASSSDTLFFVEGMYVARDDTLAGNNYNNASYRRMVVNQSNFTMSGIGQTFREIPAIFAWRDHGLGVGIPDPSVTISQIDVPGEGRFFLASKAVDLGDGTWRYEYGLHNYNSHRSAGSISIPVNTGSAEPGFHGIFYHSGEPIDSSPWTPEDNGSSITWSTVDYAVNPNANAIRWGTMYNFWFETDAAPTTGDIEIGLFRPGSPSSVMASATVPTLEDACLADFNGDGQVNFFDISAFMDAFNAQDPAADIAEPFGVWNFFDVAAFMDAYNAGCP